MKDLYKQKGQESYNRQTPNKWGDCCKVTFPQGVAGISQAGYLTSGDQVVPDGLKIAFLGEPKP